MRNNIFETFSATQNDNNYSMTLLKNCGFSPNFFYELEQNIIMLERSNIKKIKSANDITLLQNQHEKVKSKKIYEAEDKDIFNKKNYEIKKNIYLNYNSNSSINNNLSSYTTIPSQDCLNKNINDIYNKKNNTKYFINAYKSRHKTKFSKLYEINSVTLEEKNKNKLYHKCCYPGCKRTFSSSGWLKAHLKDHLKQIHNSKYCKLFEKFVLNESINRFNKKNNFFDDFKNSNNNNKINSYINLENKYQSIDADKTNNNYLLYTQLSSKKTFSLLDKDNILNGENNTFYLHHFKNEK